MKLLALIAIFLTADGGALAQTPADKQTIHERVSIRVETLLSSIEKDADFARVQRSLDSLFDELIAYAPATEHAAFREAARGRRLVQHLSRVRSGRTELLAYLRANPKLADTLAFLMNSSDRPDAAFTLLNRLRAKHEKDLNRLDALTAAFCVVYDAPRPVRVNENLVTPGDPVLLFGYFLRNERRLVHSLQEMPAELLMSVVDAAAPVHELQWALDKYGKDGRVGQRYFDIRYDKHAFRTGEEKKVTTAGFSLPNIHKHGGICADQSYFAQQVGKAQGIPTAGITGRNASMAHAWVGFFEVVAGTPRWNFDSGLYDDYKNVRGQTLDPQTAATVDDSWLLLNLDVTASGRTARQTAVAFVDAAERLASIGTRPFPPKGETIIPIREPARTTSLESRLELVEAGLRVAPTYAPGWQFVADSAGKLSTQQTRYWTEVLYSLCGEKHPDFSLAIVTPLVEKVADIPTQDTMWNSLAKTYNSRPDLVAKVRFSQAAMWRKANDDGRAWEAYHDVCWRFSNDTSFAVDAALRCVELLRRNKKLGEEVAFLAKLWPRVKRPSANVASEIKKQSNWYRVGTLYKEALEITGDTGKANQVGRDLDR